jgi:phosphatidylglycerophosphate synthase
MTTSKADVADLPVARALDGVISRHERRVLEAMAGRLSSSVTPDQLTVIGVSGAGLVAIGLIASHISTMFLALSIAGLAINWFGDSLDGTLARVRRIERPRYGFFVDHLSDLLSQFMIVLGLGLSPFLRFDIAMLALLGYLSLTVYTLVKLHVSRRMQLSYGGIGPTEVRLVIGVGLAIAMVVDLPVLASPVGPLSLYDLVAVGLFVFAALNIVVMFIIDAKQLALIDPARRTAPVEVNMIDISAPRADR